MGLMLRRSRSIGMKRLGIISIGLIGLKHGVKIITYTRYGDDKVKMIMYTKNTRE